MGNSVIHSVCLVPLSTDIIKLEIFEYVDFECYLGFLSYTFYSLAISHNYSKHMSLHRPVGDFKFSYNFIFTFPGCTSLCHDW